MRGSLIEANTYLEEVKAWKKLKIERSQSVERVSVILLLQVRLKTRLPPSMKWA
jgi:hypothetical protein